MVTERVFVGFLYAIYQSIAQGNIGESHPGFAGLLNIFIVAKLDLGELTPTHPYHESEFFSFAWSKFGSRLILFTMKRSIFPRSSKDPMPFELVPEHPSHNIRLTMMVESETIP